MAKIGVSGFRIWALAGVSAAAIVSPAWAQDARRPFQIPAQPLSAALETFGAQSGTDVIFAGALAAGKTSRPVEGSYTPDEALRRLLEGSGLTVRRANAGTFLVEAARPQAAPAAPGAALDVAQVEEIVVTGTRIRGAPPAAPVISITEEDMRNAGQSDLGEVVRSLPQNFGGGQNPGVGNTQGGIANQNVNGASSINLRGMGPDATLTLMNGSRLSYNSVNAAVDISAIPAAAVSRVEVLADGASALYGSDAVAGVANVILKRDFEGLSTTARIGTTTDGGGTQQQFSVVGGQTWTGGGFIATYDHFQNDPIMATDRAVTSAMHPESMVYPDITRQSAIFSGHQQLSRFATITGDIIYKTGEMDKRTGYIVGRPLTFRGSFIHSDVESLAVVPRAEFALPGGWSANFSGFLGYDNTTLPNRSFSNAIETLSRTVYDNDAKAVEVNAEGRIITLPGGEVRLAVGAGYRENGMEVDRSTRGATFLAYDVSQAAHYGYSELFLPLVGVKNSFGPIERLSLSVAARYENYHDMDEVITPKVGITADLGPDIIVSSSWGKSFKTPTFYQMYSEQTAVLLDATGYGAAFPAGSTYIFAGSANPDLTPERSESWVTTVRYRPSRFPDAELSISYFTIDYTDRIASPVRSVTGALTNPIYADLVTLNPTLQQINEYIDRADIGLQNGTARPFDPASVVALLDIRNRNVALQTYNGVDVSGRYQLELNENRSLTFTGAASYLESEQQLKAGLPLTLLAGSVFNAPHLRARVGTVLEDGDLTLAFFASHTGGVKDNRRATSVGISSVTTLDVTGRLKLGKGVEVSVSALNVFNAAPEAIYAATLYDTPFDSTNYSLSGRYLGVSITKSW